MFICSFKASSLKFIALACACAVAVAALIVFLPEGGAYLNVNKLDISKKLSSIDVKKEAGRLEYFETLGYSVENENVLQASEKITGVFDAATEKYNQLQRFQGFDLKRLGGKTVKSYTYNVSSLPEDKKMGEGRYLATLIVYKNKVVGADLCCPDTNEYYPLVRVS